ncbi:MAG: prepilin-type N-terminal cleavage/methylation domain-containing protein [bacterium]
MSKFRPSPESAHRSGMTLVEMMVSLAIFAVVMTVVFTFMVNSRNSYADVSERVEYQQTVRAALSLVSREIRTVGCDPTDIGFDRFAIADAGQILCRMDLDGDGVIETVEPAEQVDYWFDNDASELLRDPGTGPQTILRNVTNLVFTYFDANGNQIGPPPLSQVDRTLIRFVNINITGESDRGEPVNYATRIFVRNG